MNDLMQLLKRWGELEPDRCKHDYDTISVLRSHDGENYWTTIYSPMLADPEIGGSGQFYGGSTLQSAVQGAIVSKGWVFTLRYGFERVEVAISRVGEIHRATGEEFAIVLLEAYVLALEAIGQQEGKS